MAQRKIEETHNIPEGWGAIPPDWDRVPPGALPRKQRERIAYWRQGWFVRMAAKGVVPDPAVDQKLGALVLELLPELVTNPMQLKPYWDHKPLDVVLRVWARPPVPMFLQLKPHNPRYAVLVQAANHEAGERLLRGLLPHASAIEPRKG
ncbi:hypothetical protein [Roseobacter sp. MH60115]|uniref:hypothetical protein n=1 Tax=Roseobacter sp. MH60115 TaxID=2785324 RepID=UPI0018A31B2A|nr:hypothetical protein [Roseobacter sp. MH60115]